LRGLHRGPFPNRSGNLQLVRVLRSDEDPQIDTLRTAEGDNVLDVVQGCLGRAGGLPGSVQWPLRVGRESALQLEANLESIDLLEISAGGPLLPRVRRPGARNNHTRPPAPPQRPP